ncbi:nuclear transport factor 2 family protein [Brevundimonas faecalis]|uniref:SnoaL-like domain-containing protein n=1 Tax=Brevundimonas faecalis TaxID=947378 RepID=A0ABV2RCN7_9CAUL
MSDVLPLQPAVAASLAKWHQMIAERDLNALRAITHPDACFRSPVAFKPYRSADALILALGTVITVFEDFAYHRQAAMPDGLGVVLEFSARVGDKGVKGVDVIQFDADGLIIDFEVMMRPMNGVQALATEMGARLGHLLPAFKG